MQRIRLVASQSRRSPAELVVAEGIRVLEEADKAGCRIEALLIAESFGAEEREGALLKRWEARHIPVRRASAPVLKALSDVVAPQGALALVHVPVRAISGLRDDPNPLILCLGGIQDPGNLGTLLRTARAAGASRIFSTRGTASARNPKAIRASAGAFFHLPLVEGLEPREILEYCRARRIAMYTAAVRSANSCWDADLARPTAIVLGNEAHGLEAGDWEGIPSMRVPMADGVESLNVAAAGAVLLYEAFRQRLAAGRAGSGSER